MKPCVIGITGGIASGKTAVTDIIAELGGRIIDADIISRKVVGKGTKGEKMLIKAFPTAFNEGELDRSALRKIVFADENKRKKLNAITHPLIEKEAKRLIKEAKERVLFFAVPLLFETGFERYCDYTVVVFASLSERIKRLLKRNPNLTKEDAEAIICAQTSDAERIKKADEVLLNDGSEEDLRKIVEEFYSRVTSEA